MPSSDEGTHLTYANANTRSQGDVSRSICGSVRASAVNVDDLIFSIGSSDTTWNARKGCNRHFALSILNGTHVNVFGMCEIYDNDRIPVTQHTMYDKSFHQICVTYRTDDAKLCVYHNSDPPYCVIRSNARYNTGLGDVRIGWWPDNNRGFVSSDGGLIKSVALFDRAISQECVRQQLETR
ncbi:unnamed protein product [Rotaria sordida]|uniref:Lectin n=1 Tax=Rotaria sordida TaxID=392033 RepID=A0A820D0M8_9BILA|nr:unnamed protein product [Rotaria sordida]CAF4226318.1 unnamed protein product [Rotaria sordida]